MVNLRKRKRLIDLILRGKINRLHKHDYYVLGLKPAQIFLLTTIAIRRVKVANQLHAMSDGDLHTNCTTYVTHITGLSYCPAPLPSLASCTTVLGEFADTISAAVNNDKEKVDLKNAKRIQVMNMFTDLGNYVESCANDPVNAGVGAVAVIEAAGMRAKPFSPRGKQMWDVFRGALSGTLVLTAATFKGSGSHEWQYTTTPTDADSWIDMPATTRARTSLSGLTLLTYVYCRHRTVTTGGVSDWEGHDPVAIV